MEKRLKKEIEDIADAIEWDFYLKVFLPRTKNIKNIFKKIELNYEKHKHSVRSNK